MKRVMIVMLLAMATPVRAQETPINLEYARAYFEELAALGQADGGKLWGRAIAGPMLFGDVRTRTVVANMPDTLGLLRERDDVWIGVLPPDQMVANTSIDWAGRRWSMVMWPVSDNRYNRARLLIHESYHRIQNDLLLPAGNPANAHLGDVEARIWTRLEWRALAEALLRSGLERRMALADALTFRAKRRSLFAGSGEEERELELNEGLAEYTGFVLSGLPRSVLPDRVAVQLTQSEAQDNFARSFAYASGPAYGLLLDLADKPWRRSLSTTSDLSVLAAAAFGIIGIDAKDADARVAKYGAARMIAEERARDAQRKATLARLRAKLVDGPVLKLPVGVKFGYTFDPNGATPIPDVGTVFEGSRVSDEWGVLEVSQGGVLLARTGGNITGVAVPVAIGSEDRLKGDGWTLQLAPGWKIVAGARAGDWIVTR